MTLKNTKITMLLNVGLGSILIVFCLIALAVQQQAHRLMAQTDAIYHHPLQVRVALGRIETDVEVLSKHVRELAFNQDPKRAAALFYDIEAKKAEIGFQVEVLADRYLGPREDLAALRESLLQWHLARNETLRLLATGKVNEATRRMVPPGEGAQWGSAVRTNLAKMNTFAAAKAESLLNEAKAKAVVVNRTLMAAGILLALLLIAVGAALLAAMRQPLALLLQASERFAQGDLGARSPFESANEFGQLSAGFNTMAQAIQAKSVEQQKQAARLEEANKELEQQAIELELRGSELGEQNLELAMQKGQLEQANRLKSTFLSNMSHELRTPLNSVIALSGVLNRRLRGKVPGEEYGYLEVVERNAKHLLTLINDILDLARIEAGHEEVVLARVSVKALLDEVASMVEPQAREAGIRLLTRIDGDMPEILTDPAKCRHVLINLAANAVKFTPQGEVEIRAWTEGEELRVSVRDTGIGIAADQIPWIFAEFRQADDSMARKYGGTGLGLAIAQKYAVLLRGAIEVKSQLGQGSTFTLRLPLSFAASTWSPGATLQRLGGVFAAGTAVSGRGKRVLVVEDDESAQAQLNDILSPHEYTVLQVSSGAGALAALETDLPDVMIFDLMIPEMNGFDVLRAIRGSKRSASLPVLVLTAKSLEPEELEQLQGLGIRQWFQKGDVSPAALLAAVEGLAGTGEAEAGILVPPRRRSAARRARPPQPVVLLVEDNPDNMLTLCTLLKESCTVLEASDGSAALAIARQTRLDLVLSDIAMPGMDGFALLDALRADPSLAELPVVAVTASAMRGDRERILARGFDGYLSKPLDAEKVEAAISEVFDAGG